jgi:hypothetical protein
LYTGEISVNDFGNGDDTIFLYKYSEYTVENKGKQGVLISDGVTEVYVRGQESRDFLKPDALRDNSLVRYKLETIYD